MAGVFRSYGMRRFSSTDILLRLALAFHSTLIVLSVNLSTFRNLYMRMSDLRLSAHPVRTLQNASAEICARICVEEVTFECKSFDIDNLHRTCLLFNTSYEEGHAFLQEARLVDHYRSAYDKLFNRLPNHVLTLSHKKKVPDVSVEQCARRCTFEMSFRCKGFDYEPQHRNCWLTELSVEIGGGVKYHNGADFYERIFEGPISRFVNYGSGSLPIIDGYQIYGKVMFGLTLGACAQLCLTETTFECFSFDYSFSDRSCHMSQYIASDVNGLNHDVMPTYRVTHYEKKGKYLEFFYPTPYTIVLGRNDRTLSHVSPDNCAQSCLHERDFVCRSFDYQIQNGTCLLSTTTGSDVGRLYYQGQAQAHHFEMKPILDCGGVLTDKDGGFSSTNWPRNYEHHLNCTWYIKVAKYKVRKCDDWNDVISFDFVHFDLGPQSSNPCDPTNDRLIISEMTSRGIVQFCASRPMTSFVSKGNEVNFQFLTNGAMDAQGFRVFYTGDWPCKAELTEDNGQIASPGWPAQYPPLLDCSWTIRAPPAGRIFLQLSAVDLDGQGFGKCTDEYDVLKIYDGNSSASQRLGMLCGHDPVASYTSLGNVLYVSFKTDGHVQRTGFHATYAFVYKTTASTTSPSSIISNTTSKPSQNVEKMTSLTAQFVEPEHDRIDWGVTTPLPSGNSSIQYAISDAEDGGVFFGPGFKTASAPSDVFVRTMWALVISLLILLFVLLSTLIAVCRHYRKRIPKRRNVPNYTFTEENLSLYDKEALSSNPKDVDSPTYKFHTDPDPDIAFSNPLYESRYPAPSQSSSRRTSSTLPTMSSFTRC